MKLLLEVNELKKISKLSPLSMIFILSPCSSTMFSPKQIKDFREAVRNEICFFNYMPNLLLLTLSLYKLLARKRLKFQMIPKFSVKLR